MAAFPFPPEVVRAITTHMNDDHAEETLLICQELGGYARATAAHMTGVDGSGGDYLVTIDGETTSARIPWAHPITERAQVRHEVVRMYREAYARRSLSPRGETTD